MAEPQPSSIEALSRGLSFAIGRANRRMLAAGKGLGQGHLNALATMYRVGPIRPGDLAQREFVSAPTMTRTLRDLEKLGLVSRIPDASDGRSILVNVTGAGEHEVLRARSARAEMLADLLLKLDRDEVAALRDALAALERLATIDTDRPD
ncbi:MAG: MarR family transcriptional regulator [Actinomycetota bacterium]|nr:MarR family transcriptional regulator [Actinomycetota bacterium]